MKHRVGNAPRLCALGPHNSTIPAIWRIPQALYDWKGAAPAQFPWSGTDGDVTLPPPRDLTGERWSDRPPRWGGRHRGRGREATTTSGDARLRCAAWTRDPEVVPSASIVQGRRDRRGAAQAVAGPEWLRQGPEAVASGVAVSRARRPHVCARPRWRRKVAFLAPWARSCDQSFVWTMLPRAAPPAWATAEPRAPVQTRSRGAHNHDRLAPGGLASNARADGHGPAGRRRSSASPAHGFRAGCPRAELEQSTSVGPPSRTAEATCAGRAGRFEGVEHPPRDVGPSPALSGSGRPSWHHRCAVYRDRRGPNPRPLASPRGSAGLGGSDRSSAAVAPTRPSRHPRRATASGGDGDLPRRPARRRGPPSYPHHADGVQTSTVPARGGPIQNQVSSTCTRGAGCRVGSRHAVGSPDGWPRAVDDLDELMDAMSRRWRSSSGPAMPVRTRRGNREGRGVVTTLHGVGEGCGRIPRCHPSTRRWRPRTMGPADTVLLRLLSRALPSSD